MNARRLFSGLWLSALCLAAASPAFGLANRVFASARSGNDANSCDNIATPCKTLAGAVSQLNPDGEAIVLDSGGYGPVTIAQGITIEAPAGVTAFIHPPSGDAITINAGASDKVTLRGLTLNVGTNGIIVNSGGTLNVVNCFITGFSGDGIKMLSAGHLNVKGTDITACGHGVNIANSSGVAHASIDHCHLDGNTTGYVAGSTSPGASTTTATYTTASGNAGDGWLCGILTTGLDFLNLEFCTGSENGSDGIHNFSANATSRTSYSNCVITDNAVVGVERQGGIVDSRGNNTILRNGTATSGTIGTFPPM